MTRIGVLTVSVLWPYLPLPSLVVAVMVVVPAFRALMNPPPLLTVATVGSLLVQVKAFSSASSGSTMPL